MKSVITAIYWEMWRKSRPAIIGVAVFMVLWAIANSFLNRIENVGEIPRESRNAVSLLFFACASAACLFVFSYTENDRKKGFAGPPTRIFSLPVATGVLVTLPMVAGIVALGLIYLYFSRLILIPTGLPMPDERAVLAIPAAVASFQAILWGAG